jgi:hypothetical protein
MKQNQAETQTIENETIALPEVPNSQLSTINRQSSEVLLTKEDQLPVISAPISAPEVTALMESKPATATPASQRRKIRRNGRVASLPKTERDMVNRMLWNAVPYKNIVAAVDELGYLVTERNISNWATGGYLEWRLEQEAVLQNRLDQDHMLDFLRRDDAHDLPEVGLQAAATRLSQVLLQKLAHADDPEAQLDNFSRMIDLLCRLNREISATQKDRNESRRVLGPEYNPVRVRDTEEYSAIEMERFYSNPPDGSKLPKPAERAAVPPFPTAVIMAEQADEERMEAELRREEGKLRAMQLFLGKKKPRSKQAPNDAAEADDAS